MTEINETSGPFLETKSTGQGRLSATLGVLAMGLAMAGPCTCYIGFIAAIILGIVAQMTSKTALAEGVTGEDYAYANVGKWTSLIAMIWSLLILLLIAAYIVFYIVFVGLMLSNL